MEAVSFKPYTCIHFRYYNALLQCQYDKEISLCKKRIILDPCYLYGPLFNKTTSEHFNNTINDSLRS